MSVLSRFPGVLWVWGGLLVAALGFSGCVTTQGDAGAEASTSSTRAGIGKLAPNEHLVITFSGVSSPPDRFEGVIKEDGTISLPYIPDVIVAAGKLPAELEKEIHDAYVPKFYVRLTVNVTADNRVFYVDGEVRNPSRLVYASEMSVVRAIAAAGGFTDFAKKSRIQLIRANGKVFMVNYNRAKSHPEADLPVYPGDKIIVLRRII